MFTKEAISIAVLNGSGKLVMESIIATKAITIVEFMQGLRGELQVTFEEGTWSAWLYDLLKPHGGPPFREYHSNMGWRRSDKLRTGKWKDLANYRAVRTPSTDTAQLLKVSAIHWLGVC